MLTRLLSSLSLAALVACNAPTTESESHTTGEERFHEKSFSWDQPHSEAGLAKLATRETRFETDSALVHAIVSLEENLRLPGFSDSLWKPIDHACDELSLALWNVHGTVRLRDSVVLDEAILRAGCRYIGEDPSRTVEGAAKSAAVYPTAVETDRQYPYKMIGESWDDFNIGVYKSTGGETQFKKHRKKFGFTGWYDTDATRIGVRIYLADCSLAPPRRCVVRHSTSGWYAHDDYVSKRETAVGGIIEYPLGGALMNLRVADGVISMHSADHAGLQFRAVSSSGLTSNTELTSQLFFDHVTW